MTGRNHLRYAIVIYSAISMTVFAQFTELTYSIREESPGKTFVGNVLDDSNIRDAVSPRDILDLRFAFLTEKNPQTSLLWINSTNGELRTSSRINRESICQKMPICELRVQTVVQAQLGAFFKIVLIKVAITDINDNSPTFIPSTYTIKVAESVIPGTIFHLPTATDLDASPENSIIDYSVIDTDMPFSLILDKTDASFDIRLRLDDNLDMETTSMYQFFLLAVDGGNPRLTGTLTVNVDILDVNDNSPVFDKQDYSVNISDSMAVDSIVVVVKATDLDSGDNGLVTYRIPSIQEDVKIFEMFYINGSTGEVRTKVMLDSFAGYSYRLQIRAQDSGSTHRTDSTVMTIFVLDRHNSQPEILLNVFGTGGLAQVSEMAELGRAVAHVAVSDPDSNMSANGQLSCFLNNTDQFQLQPMDTKQFKVILTLRLDREQLAFHSVTVHCEDAGTPPLSASAGFIVEVVDENDNAPVFSSLYYTADVREGKYGGAEDKRGIVLSVSASDKDTGLNAQLTYRLAEGTDSDFGLYSDGSIVVTNPLGLDREDRVKGGVRNLVVLAVDSGKTPLTGSTIVSVTIKDINDNPPRFSEPVYFFNVMENAPVNQTVSDLSATDSDLEINGIFYFEIHHRYLKTVPFDVSLGGTVRISGEIDRETKSSYQFYVIAYDLGEPRQFSTVAVRITITDVNDNSPKFVFPNDENYTIWIPYTQSVNDAFAIILATDPDEGRNGEIGYSVYNGNGSKHFSVHSESGQVVIDKPFTIKEFGLHVLTVFAHDRGLDVQLTTKSILHIIVYESNATISLQDDGDGVRNVVVAAALVVITAILALTIFFVIIILRRFDTQIGFYPPKVEAPMDEQTLKHLSPYFIGDPDSSKIVPNMADTNKEGEKKKKEVSFFLEDVSIVSGRSTLTTCSSLVFEKYDALPGRTGQNILTTFSGLDKDITGNDTSNNIRAGDSVKDNGDAAGRSNLCVSKTTDNTPSVSVCELEPRNNLNVPSNRDVDSVNCIKTGNTTKTVQFHNICPEPVHIGSRVTPNTPSSVWPRSHRSRIHSEIPLHYNVSKILRNNSIVNSTKNDNFRNQAIPNVGRHLSLTNQIPEYNHIGSLIDNTLANKNNQHMSSTNPKRGYIITTDARSYSSDRSNSNSCIDETDTWDGDTTTSGSYTVDSQELCDEIGTFVFDNIRDIVV